LPIRQMGTNALEPLSTNAADRFPMTSKGGTI
jgi:hypothetical protein